MTRRNFRREGRSSIGLHLRDERSAVSDHLRSHVHLTNCIHLRNHMHRRSPFPGDRSLVRDLIALQRSRSLRDPSTSPPSWLSPSIVSTLAKRAARDGAIHSRRRSVDVDLRREIGRLSASSLVAPGVTTSKVAAAEGSSDENVTDSVRHVTRSKGDEPSTSEVPPRALVQEKVGARRRNVPRRSASRQNVCLKSLSEQLEEVTSQKDDTNKQGSHVCQHRRHSVVGRICEEPEASSSGRQGGSKKINKRRPRGARIARRPTDSRGYGVRNGMSIASNSLARCPTTKTKDLDNGQVDDAEQEVSQGPRNVCGIPWNWSRIHNRGKTFLDKAGRSLSCGLSDYRLRKSEGRRPMPESQEDASNKPLASDPLSSSPHSDSEVLPLLLEASGSQESTGNSFFAQDCSGELGIFANHNLSHERDSDLESEARSGHHHKSQGRYYGRHQSLAQKYMPRTFKDLVGQNLVVQALYNSVVRKKVGLVYVFYGSHGTGKTSCAHVFAKSLNCHSTKHPKPCDVCTSCISHNLGKSRNTVEIGPVGNLDFESIMDILDNVISSPLSTHYRVFIIDDCDTLSLDAWSIISKVIDRAPRHVVFVLIGSNIDHLPHMIMSRCQKFFFPKLKDSDIICTLQWIATSEGLEIDKDALKLIASRSDGSLRDAMMTLEQLSLLGQRISLSVVQELVGFVSDEKLVNLLDLALSADTVNTVKNLREIMETGVEPLALISQLATIITDILAGSYVFTQKQVRRKFFRRLALSKEDMEKLRQALKTLFEAEKQLRATNDKITWLTAALLQLAPDQQYMMSSSSKDTSIINSPTVLNNSSGRDILRNSTNILDDVPNCGNRGLVKMTGVENHNNKGANAVVLGNNMNSSQSIRKGHVRRTVQAFDGSTSQKENETIWKAVLETISSDELRHFLSQEGKLISICLGAVPTVRLMFSSHAKKSKAERFRAQIVQAFQYVLHSEIMLEISCSSKKYTPADDQVPVLHSRNGGPSQMRTNCEPMANEKSLSPESDKCMQMFTKESGADRVASSDGRQLYSDPFQVEKDEIVEVGGSPELEQFKQRRNVAGLSGKSFENAWIEEDPSMQHQQKESGEPSRNLSLVKGKVSLARVIQQAEGCTHRSGWSKRKAISIAEKLEQENLRLEPKSRSSCCWRSSRVTRGKLPHLRTRTRRSRSMLKVLTCGRCLHPRSPI